MRPREFPHRLTRVIITSCYTASYTYSLPKGWRIGCPGGRDHPRDGLTPERPRESNLLGTASWVSFSLSSLVWPDRSWAHGGISPVLRAIAERATARTRSEVGHRDKAPPRLRKPLARCRVPRPLLTCRRRFRSNNAEPKKAAKRGLFSRDRKLSHSVRRMHDDVPALEVPAGPRRLATGYVVLNAILVEDDDLVRVDPIMVRRPRVVPGVHAELVVPLAPHDEARGGVNLLNDPLALEVRVTAGDPEPDPRRALEHVVVAVQSVHVHGVTLGVPGLRIAHDEAEVAVAPARIHDPTPARAEGSRRHVDRKHGRFRIGACVVRVRRVELHEDEIRVLREV